MRTFLPLLAFFRRRGGRAVLAGRREILADFRQDPLQRLDLGTREIDGRRPIDFPRRRQKQFAQGPCRLCEVDIRLAAIARVLHANHQAALFHRMQGRDRGGLADPDAVAELPLAQAVFFPQDAQEVPHTQRDTIRPYPGFEFALQGAMCPSYLVPHALFGRIGEPRFDRGMGGFASAALRHCSFVLCGEC